MYYYIRPKIDYLKKKIHVFQIFLKIIKIQYIVFMCGNTQDYFYF